MAATDGFVIANDEVDAEPETESTRRMDSELRVLGQIIRQLADVGPAASKRIMAYLSDRYAA